MKLNNHVYIYKYIIYNKFKYYRKLLPAPLQKSIYLKIGRANVELILPIGKKFISTHREEDLLKYIFCKQHYKDCHITLYNDDKI